MIVVDSVEISKQQVTTGEVFTIKIQVREVFANWDDTKNEAWDIFKDKTWDDMKRKIF